MNGQTILPIDAPHQPSFDNFVIGPNQELCAGLSSWPCGFSGFWLRGEAVCGKTHLLRASCLSAAESGFLQAYIDCLELSVSGFVDAVGDLIGRIRQGADLSVCVALDHVEAVRGEAGAEEILMALYNVLNDGGADVPRRLLVAHRHSAGQLSFALADLNSRLRALAHYQLQPLNDDEKSHVMTRRAEQRGYRLADNVLEYWLRRGPRGIDQLLADLDRLDQATLEQQRLLTVPLLKSVLGY